MPVAQLYHGDVLKVLKTLPSESVHCTTGVAAMRHGRNYIGIDIDHDAILDAHDRIYEESRLFNKVEVLSI